MISDKKFIHEKTIMEPQNPRISLEKVLPLSTPYIVWIDPCSICNFYCDFCPCNDRRYIENWDKRHKMMSFELFKKVVEDLKDFPEKIRVVYLDAFGEPLLNPDICKMIRYLKDSEVCNEIRIFTNGSMLSPQLNQDLVNSGLDYIRISVESLYEKDYSNICKYKINMNKFIANIKDLYEKSRGSQLRVGIKIIDGTLKSLEDVNRFFEIYSNISDYHYTEMLADRWANFKIPDEAKQYISWDKYMKEESQSKHVCSKGFWSICVCANGDVTPCDVDWSQALVIGNVSDSALKDIWNSAQLREWQKKQLRGDVIENCFNCKYWCNEHLDEHRELLLKRLGEDQNEVVY